MKFVELFLKKKNIGLFHFHFFNKNKQYFYYDSTWKFNCKFMHLTHKIKSTLQSMISTSNNIEGLKLSNSLKVLHYLDSTFCSNEGGFFGEGGGNA